MDVVKWLGVLSGVFQVINFKLEIGRNPTRLNRRKIRAYDMRRRKLVCKLNGPNPRSSTAIENATWVFDWSIEKFSIEDEG